MGLISFHFFPCQSGNICKRESWRRNDQKHIFQQEIENFFWPKSRSKYLYSFHPFKDQKSTSLSSRRSVPLFSSFRNLLPQQFGYRRKLFFPLFNFFFLRGLHSWENVINWFIHESKTPRFVFMLPHEDEEEKFNWKVRKLWIGGRSTLILAGLSLSLSFWSFENKKNLCKNNLFNLFSLLFQLTKAVTNLLCS